MFLSVWRLIPEIIWTEHKKQSFPEAGFLKEIQIFFFFLTIFFFFVFFFFHPSSVILETILWVDGFPIVSVLGSCCLGVGLCQLLPSMLINVIISSYIHPHSPTFTETISDELRHADTSTCFHCSYLCAAWTVFLLLCRGLHSASTSVAGSGHPGSLPKRWSPKLGMPDSTQTGIEPGNCRTAVWHSIHWATTSPTSNKFYK